VLLWIVVIGTILWIIGQGMTHGNFLLPLQTINNGITLNHGFAAAIGFASVKTVYSYLGYYNVCHLGGDIIDPSRNIPRSMLMSIAGIFVLYMLMNISIVSVIPWHEAMQSEYVISLFMHRLGGPLAGKIITALILLVAFASVFSATLGYSRIPYAAAVDGAFFKVFARVHPRGNFPYVSILFLGTVAFIFSLLFRLSDVISAILAMRILVQFIGQAVGLLLLANNKRKHFPYKMPFFPVPVYIAIVMWLCILISTGIKMVAAGVGIITLGLLVYFIKDKMQRR